MYPEIITLIRDAQRELTTAALTLEAGGKPFFAARCRDRAEQLGQVLAPGVACCPWRTAQDELNSLLELGAAIRARVPADAPQASFSAPTVEERATGQTGMFDDDEDEGLTNG